MDPPTAQRRIKAIVAALEKRGRRWTDPIEEAIELALGRPEAVEDLVTAVIRSDLRSGIFLAAALCFLPEGQWDGLVRFALDALEETSDGDAACSVIAYAGQQSLTSLHPHLDRIFRLGPNEGTYYEDYPWRESGTGHFEFLRGVIEEPGSEPELRLKAWQSMLQTRHPEMLAYVVAHVDPVQVPSPGLTLPEMVEAHLRLVGYHQDHEGLRRLCPDTLYHLAFPKGFFEGESRPAWLARIHPTWSLEPTPDLPPMRFGGLAEGHCALCGGRLHRLLTFEPVPDGLGVTGLGRLELATCLPCLGWEKAPLFYRHAEDGKAVDVGHDGPTVVPRFRRGPLREAEVRLAVTPRRWRWQDWALSNDRENLNRVGGEPSRIQDPEYLDCPDCGDLMSHLMQLDSELPTALDDEWMLWGSGGIGFVSWCDRCKISGLFWLCT